MPKFNHILQNFIGGEVSPKMYGRVDTDIYRASLKKLKNMWVFPQGGAGRRTGTRFITNELSRPGAASNNNYIQAISEDAVCFPFVVNDDEVYIGIIGQGDTQTDRAIYIYNTFNERMMRVHLELDTSGLDRIGSTYQSSNDLSSAALLEKLQIFQKGDILYIVHPSIPPLQLIRYGYEKFWLEHWYNRPKDPVTTASFQSTLDKVKAWPMTPIKSGITISASAAAVGSRTLTASQSFFTANMVGTPMAVQDSGTVGYAIITAYTSATVVTALVVQALPGTSAYSGWFEAAWSPRRGYPASGVFWNGSLLMGDTTADPGTIWKSQVGDIYEFTNNDIIDPAGTPTDSDPVSYTIAAEDNNYIQWIESQRDSFLVGTSSREYNIPAFSVTEVQVEAQTSTGSDYIQPVVVGGVPLYVQRGGRRIREMVYQERINGYVSQDTTFYAEHITRESQNQVDNPEVPRIKGLTYQKTPHDIVWAWDNNGYLYACTRKLEGEITAWHRHEIAGTYGNNAFAYVVSCASVPRVGSGGYDLYLIVRRTIDGSDVVFLEKLQPDFDWLTLHPDTDLKDREPVYLDCAKIFRVNDTATFRAKLKTTATADSAAGSTTATVTGTLSFSEGFANTDANPGAYISYDGTSNVDHAQVGCIRFKYRLSTDVGTMLTVAKAAGDADNLIAIAIGATGYTLNIKDSAGVDIIPTTTMGSFAHNLDYGTSEFPTDQVLVELNYDLTNGATRLFINGKQAGSTLTQTGTRDTSIDLLRIGADYNGANVLNGGYSDVEIFSTVQHTEDHDMYEYQVSSTTISNLDYLEGEEVTVLANGKDQGEFTVTSGSITLEEAFDTIIVGLKYESVLTTQSLEAGSGVGSAQGRPTRIDYLALRLYATAQCNFGRNESNQEEIDFTDPDADMDDPIPLFTGDKVLPFAGDYEVDSGITVTAERPLPMNITCLVARGMTND